MRILLFLLLSINTNFSTAECKTLYGVSTHFAQNKTKAEFFKNLIGSASFNSIRDEIYWHDVEKEKGVFQLTGKAKLSVDMINMSAAKGMTPLVVLDYGNKHYDGGDQPYSDEGRHAFGRYCGWIVNQLSENVTHFEIWNEWNHGMGSVPPRKFGNPSDYVKLTKSCSEEIQKARPNATILGGAVTNDWGEWPWLTQAIHEGLLNHVSGVSAHIYSFLIKDPNKQEEFIANRIDSLNRILGKHAKKDIYITEIGWPNHKGAGETSHESAATFLSRTILLTQQYKEIKGVWIYELKDGGLDKSDKEHNFGLFDYKESPKPAYCKLNNILRHTSNKKLYINPLKIGLITRQYTNEKQTEKISVIFTENWASRNFGKRFEISSESDFELLDGSCQEIKYSATRILKLEISQDPILIRHTKNLTIKTD